MNSLYLDTNFFIYLSNKTSPFFSECYKFVEYCKKERVVLYTSAETIQEIIHYTKNIKQLEEGLRVSKEVFSLVDELLSLNTQVIETYLKFAAIYKNAGSRDLIHLAVCVENKIDKIVTFDKDFSKFKEVQILIPKDILN